jgi:hypothetical protein
MMKKHEMLQSLSAAVNQAPIGLLDAIQAQPVVKQQETDYFIAQKAETAKRTPSTLSRFFKPIASAAVALCAFALVFNLFMAFQVDSEIFLDVNPSIEIDLNRKQNVVRLNGHNQEARQLIEQIDYKGRNVREVLLSVLDEMYEQGYLTQEKRFVLLSVYNKNPERARSQKRDLRHVIGSYMEANNIDPLILSQAITTSRELRQTSEQFAVPCGKMYLIQNLVSTDDSFAPDKLSHLTTGELIRLATEKGIALPQLETEAEWVVSLTGQVHDESGDDDRYNDDDDDRYDDDGDDRYDDDDDDDRYDDDDDDRYDDDDDDDRYDDNDDNDRYDDDDDDRYDDDDDDRYDDDDDGRYDDDDDDRYDDDDDDRYDDDDGDDRYGDDDDDDRYGDDDDDNRYDDDDDDDLYDDDDDDDLYDDDDDDDRYDDDDDDDRYDDDDDD